MATYIVLVNFTEQGIRTVKDSPLRYEACRAIAQKQDIEVKSVYWTTGAYDLVLTAEGTDDALTAALLRLGAQGNVRTRDAAWPRRRADEGAGRALVTEPGPVQGPGMGHQVLTVGLLPSHKSESALPATIYHTQQRHPETSTSCVSTTSTRPGAVP